LHTAFIQGGEYENATSEVMNSDMQTELSSTLVAKHLVYQAVLGYGKVSDKRGMTIFPGSSQAQKLIQINRQTFLA
jgi:hypothetical protein